MPDLRISNNFGRKKGTLENVSLPRPVALASKTFFWLGKNLKSDVQKFSSDMEGTIIETKHYLSCSSDLTGILRSLLKDET